MQRLDKPSPPATFLRLAWRFPTLDCLLRTADEAAATALSFWQQTAVLIPPMSVEQNLVYDRARRSPCAVWNVHER